MNRLKGWKKIISRSRDEEIKHELAIFSVSERRPVWSRSLCTLNFDFTKWKITPIDEWKSVKRSFVHESLFDVNKVPELNQNTKFRTPTSVQIFVIVSLSIRVLVQTKVDSKELEDVSPFARILVDVSFLVMNVRDSPPNFTNFKWSFAILKDHKND